MREILQAEIIEQEREKQRADDAEQHDKYRYREGVIAGLNYAIAIINDRLMSIEQW